jgi:integrase
VCVLWLLMAIHKRGSGTIYRRGKTWWMQYFVRGRLVQETTGFTQKADAENLLKQRIGEVAAGRRVGPERATIADLCKLVMEDNRMRNLRDARHVEWRYSANVAPVLGCLLASRFGQAQVRQYIASRRNAGASNATINRELAIVRRGFKLGVREDPPLVQRQAVIPVLEEDNVRQGFLEQDQYEKLLEELPANLRALFVCGYHVGARKNELRRIQWPQVDFDCKAIRLPASQTKTKKPRTLPIYGDMLRWLEDQRAACPADCVWVFWGRGNHPVDNHLNGWSEACERAGLPGLLFHDLRRSAVRNMKRAGIQDKVAMEITGHRTRSVFDRYNIIDEADVRGAGQLLEEYANKRKQERAARLRRVK